MIKRGEILIRPQDFGLKPEAKQTLHIHREEIHLEMRWLEP